MAEKIRPKVGVALSGASGRAIAHIAILEVFQEHQIPIDYIAGCSSGAAIAASFATGSMDYLKDLFYRLDFRKLMGLWSTKNAKGAIFHLHNSDMNEVLNNITKGLRFEDVRPKLGFTATDLNTGELVTLSMGDMNKAIMASVAVPGLFEPVVWGNKILVDGGLVNVVPTLPVRQMGADVVIGINLAATKFIYEHRMPIWRGYRFLTRFMGLQFIRERVLPILSPKIFFRIDSQSDILEQDDIKIPGVMSVLAKAIDHSYKIEKQWRDSDIACDLMLEPKVKHYGKAEFKHLRTIYDEGRKEALAAIPQIRKMIDDWRPNSLPLTERLKALK